MSNRVSVTANLATPSAPVPMDNGRCPVNIGVFVIVTGVATYTVEVTDEDCLAPGFNPATANWIAHPTLSGLSANAVGNFLAPGGCFRVRVTAGAGSVRMTSIQAG